MFIKTFQIYMYVHFWLCYFLQTHRLSPTTCHSHKTHNLNIITFLLELLHSSWVGCVFRHVLVIMTCLLTILICLWQTKTTDLKLSQIIEAIKYTIIINMLYCPYIMELNIWEMNTNCITASTHILLVAYVYNTMNGVQFTTMNSPHSISKYQCWIRTSSVIRE